MKTVEELKDLKNYGYSFFQQFTTSEQIAIIINKLNEVIEGYANFVKVPYIKGNWSQNENYIKFDLVNYNGETYICKRTCYAPTDIKDKYYFEKLSYDIELLKEALDHYKNVEEWDKIFTETSGKIEEKYTIRLNQLFEDLGIERGRIDILDLVTKGITSPEMFGAKGDGITDDTEPIKKAIKHGGIIICSHKYRIKGDIELNETKDITTELGIKSCTIIGSGKNTSLTNSIASLDDISENEATFIFDGGKFRLQGTSKVDFQNCVFMGSKSSLMNNTAFELTSPARKLNIKNSTFVNLKYGIHCDESERWSGESIFDSLYFMLCDIGIYYEKGGKDCEIINSIWQGNCNHSVILKNSLGCLFSGNHDYSKLGCEFWYGANIVGNYFDGLGKLKIGCSYDTSGSTTKKPSSHGTVITGNTFLTTFHNTEVKDYVALVTLLTPYFVSCIITDNKLDGGYDNAKVVIVDLTNVQYSGDNVVTNNTGGIDALFKGSTNSNNGFYKNTYNGFTPKFVYDSEKYPDVKSGFINCGDGIIGFIRIKNTTLGNETIEISNILSSKINSLTFRVDKQGVTTISTNSSYKESTLDGNLQVSLFFIENGQKPLIERLFTI